MATESYAYSAIRPTVAFNCLVSVTSFIIFVCQSELKFSWLAHVYLEHLSAHNQVNERRCRRSLSLFFQKL